MILHFIALGSWHTQSINEKNRLPISGKYEIASICFKRLLAKRVGKKTESDGFELIPAIKSLLFMHMRASMLELS